MASQTKIHDFLGFTVSAEWVVFLCKGEKGLRMCGIIMHKVIVINHQAKKLEHLFRDDGAMNSATALILSGSG